MSFTITTVYPDGRTETREATAEEVAQREADLVAFAAEEEARQQAIAEREAAKASAQAKLGALGLTEAEIAAITGIS
jgi:DNA-directed RNA polymerase specialized sigma24 family protein